MITRKELKKRRLEKGFCACKECIDKDVAQEKFKKKFMKGFEFQVK